MGPARLAAEALSPQQQAAFALAQPRARRASSAFFEDGVAGGGGAIKRRGIEIRRADGRFSVDYRSRGCDSGQRWNKPRAAFWAFDAGAASNVREVAPRYVSH